MFHDSDPGYRRAVCAFAAAIAIAAVPLGGCGVKGPLKLPAPAPATATPPAAVTGTAAEPPAAAAQPPAERKP